MVGPNSLPDSNSSGLKTESKIRREQLLFAELAPSIFHSFNEGQRWLPLQIHAITRDIQIFEQAKIINI